MRNNVRARDRTVAVVLTAACCTGTVVWGLAVLTADGEARYALGVVAVLTATVIGGITTAVLLWVRDQATAQQRLDAYTREGGRHRHGRTGANR